MSETLIKVENASKKFCRSLKQSLWYGMQDLGNELLGHRPSSASRLRSDEFWAVDDVSFEVKRGECLGLIGSNGAGKTTLLRMLNGLIKPDQGRIEIGGRVGALIALGAGFNPVLTGRENIYVNAAVLGFSKHEIARRFDEIVSFSGLEQFLDAPVQTYSSGMQVRLGFAIAAHADLDILLLDEVLAVGDAEFRAKCYQRITSIRNNAAIILVSHNMEQIGRVAQLALWLDKGKSRHLGDVDAVVLDYENRQGSNPDQGTFVSEDARISNTCIEVDYPPGNADQSLRISIAFDSSEQLTGFRFRLWIYNQTGGYAAESVLNSTEHRMHIAKGKNHWIITFASLSLRQGNYWASVFLITSEQTMLLWGHRVAQVRIESNTPGRVVDYQLSAQSWANSPA
ncbi:MAG: ABC transporter ATP-binding protein [Rhodocyclaceae bacterium]|nr:ABC transporter ATP-binding protein [Rhodocyclaceae bacterium]